MNLLFSVCENGNLIVHMLVLLYNMLLQCKAPVLMFKLNLEYSNALQISFIASVFVFSYDI